MRFLQYVGTYTYDSQKCLPVFLYCFISLKMISNHKEKLVVLTPDDLYSRYIEFLPLLAPNAMTWSFFLGTLFFHALPSELQEVVQLGGVCFT